MAIDDRELDQRLKDQLRMIEMGETLEDLNDPEEYEDEGGLIKHPEDYEDEPLQQTPKVYY